MFEGALVVPLWAIRVGQCRYGWVVSRSADTCLTERRLTLLCGSTFVDFCCAAATKSARGDYRGRRMITSGQGGYLSLSSSSERRSSFRLPSSASIDEGKKT